MSDPRITALVCALAAAWIGYMIFSAAEAPSQMLAVVQWGFLIVALLGLVTAIIRLLRERP